MSNAEAVLDIVSGIFFSKRAAEDEITWLNSRDTDSRFQLLTLTQHNAVVGYTIYRVGDGIVYYLPGKAL